VTQDKATTPIPGPSSEDLIAWLAAARSGESNAAGNLFRAFQPYLTSIAQRDAPAMLRCKCDHTDLVQETLLRAHRGFPGFEGYGLIEFRAWLRAIMKHVIADHNRRYRETHKRTVGRELSLDAYLELCQVGDEPVDRHETPHDRAVSMEQAAALMTAIEHLRPDERTAILSRSEALSFGEIGNRLSRSPEAARKLFWRALVRLHDLLHR